MSGFDNLMQKFGAGSDSTADFELPSPTRPCSLEAFIQKHARVSEILSFYKGTVGVRLDKKEHEYYRLGELGNLISIDGVTDTTGIIDRSNMLTPWAAKVTILKLLRLIPVETVDGVIRIKPITLQEFTVIAEQAKTAHKDKLDEASDTGGLAHKCLEDSINYALTNDPEKIVRSLINLPNDERAVNAANSGKNWMDAHRVRWVETEQKVYSKEWDYAGTCDGLCICDSCNDICCCPTPFKDRLSVADWKSSNHLSLRYLFQVASYRHAKMEEFPENYIADCWILRLGKDEDEAGKFEPWHVESEEDHKDDFDGFLACLSLVRLIAKVEDRTRTRKADIRAVRKEQRETARALAKEQEKLRKALEKAAAKLARAEEKRQIKEEAKKAREEAKAAAKKGKQCTSTSTLNPESTPLVSTNQTDNGFPNQNTPHVLPQQDELHGSTVEKSVQDLRKEEPLKSMNQVDSTTTPITFETEAPQPIFNLPMEKK